MRLVRLLLSAVLIAAAVTTASAAPEKSAIQARADQFALVNASWHQALYGVNSRAQWLAATRDISPEHDAGAAAAAGKAAAATSTATRRSSPRRVRCWDTRRMPASVQPSPCASSAVCS